MIFRLVLIGLLTTASTVYFPLSADAGPSQNTAVTNSVFVQACGGLNGAGGGVGGAGEDISASFVAGTGGCAAQSVVGGIAVVGNVGISKSSNGNSYVTDAFGSAGMGWMKLYADSANSAAVAFPAGEANGGWTTTLTVPVQSGHNLGDAGHIVFGVKIKGNEGSQFKSGLSGALFTVFVNHATVARDAYFDTHYPTPILGAGGTPGYQTHEFYANAFTQGNPSSVTSRVLNDPYYFDIPYQMGVPFTLGVYGAVEAGMGTCCFLASDTAAAITDFSHTITWDGIASIDVGGIALSSPTIESDSGIDWTQPVSAPSTAADAPEPATLAVLSVPLLAMIGARRRRRG